MSLTPENIKKAVQLSRSLFNKKLSDVVTDEEQLRQWLNYANPITVLSAEGLDEYIQNLRSLYDNPIPTTLADFGLK